MKASYDVTFIPMTNVVIDVNDPKNPSEKEQEDIINRAAEKVKENIEEKISCENVAQIRLYSVNDKEEAESKVVFDTNDLQESPNPIDESLRLLTALTKSGYIPFSSPFPCSTEVKLRDCILEAISKLEAAQVHEKNLHYR